MKHLLTLSLFLVIGLFVVSSCNKEKEKGTEPEPLEPPMLEGIVINGVRWATCNVDAPGTFAANSEDAGMFYQWNRKVGWSITNPMINSDGGTKWDDTYPPSDEIWVQENDPCPPGWRVPKGEELKSLENVDHYYGELNGVSGRFFGDNDNRLFLPAAGLREGVAGVLVWVKDGYYWGSTVNPQTFNAYGMGFDSTELWTGDGKRIHGFCIRCVAAENKQVHQ